MRIRLPKTRRYRVYIYIVSTLLVLLAIDLSWVRIWRHITISPQTTVITAPLKPDGMPDYLQYIDDRTREGVTAENNAFIPFLEAITPTRPSPQTGQSIMMTEYYTRLSLKPPTEPRSIASFEDFLKAQTPPETYSDARTKEEEFVRTHPWSAAEHPDVAAWLDGYEKTLRLLPAITSRTRWYMPVIRSNPHDLLIAIIFPHLNELQRLCRVVVTRAMLEIHEKRFVEAQADILACHRLARLVVQGWALVDTLVGVGFDRMALRADAILAASPDLPAAQLRQFIVEWEGLAPWPKMENSLDFERFVVPDVLIYASQHIEKTSTLLDTLSDGPSNMNAVPSWVWRLRPAHFNAVLRKSNAFADQLLEAARAPTALQREQQVAAVDAAREAFFQQYQNPLTDPAWLIAGKCVPKLSSVFQFCDEREMTAGLTRVALALALYRADNGAYPDNLAALSPRYLTNVPQDIFSEQPLHYRKTDAGYVLYSVGVDRKDDGGKPPENGNTRRNDLVIQVPE